MRRFHSVCVAFLFVLVASGVVIAPVQAETEVIDTARVSFGVLEGNDTSEAPVISADGSTIVYSSGASNLVADDNNDSYDVFVYDVATATTTRVSVAFDDTEEANADSYDPVVSGDGSIIVYSSDASNLVADDTNDAYDVFVYDVVTATTTRVSVATDDTEEANDDSYDPAVSGDGSTIVYSSNASNLVADDNNDSRDVFVYDVATATTTRVSVATNGTETTGSSYDPAVSGDGSTIVYYSYASNLVADDNNDSDDVFVTGINRSPLAGGFSATVAEDVTVGTVVGTVTGTDPDNDPLSYNITAGNDASLFAIDGNGAITVVKPLDHETAVSHTLTVGVSDGSLVATTVVTINVTDVDEPDPDYDPFYDDDGSIFETDIEWIAAKGITQGCNPPVNDMFCPTSYVTRGQMAAFLVRALGYIDDGGGDLFIDDDDSIFEGDIDRMGTAGVTHGCNPPTNDMFCPTSYVTRGQMAALLHRTLG